ncbi:hypothetical protein ACS0TY_003546 [Phlomoides rotata]
MTQGHFEGLESGTFRNVYVVLEEAAEALNAGKAETALLGDNDDRLMTEDRDRNTNFFHTMNRVRKTSTGLSSLLIDGDLSFDTEIISNRVVDFCMDLFTDHDQGTYDDSTLGDFVLPSVDQVDNDYLSYLPSVDEIKRAAFDMGALECTRYIHFGLNSSFVILIPKKPGANCVEDFRPIVMVTRRVKNALLRTMGISEGALPLSYLGVPVFRGALRTCHLVVMADSIIAKFSKWKGHAISLAGRKCMINSIIAALLVHSMMVYYWPRSLLKKIESAIRNFLWTGDISKKKTS